MNVAKKFFYVCAGLLMLAVAYHLGALNAGAQSSQFRVLHPDGVIETGGQVYALGELGWVVPSSLPPVPATSIVAGHGPYITVDGTAWRLDAYTGEWRSYPLPGGPTPTRPSTFGSIKAKYR